MEQVKEWQHLSTDDLHNVLLQVLYALQFLWVMAVVDIQNCNPKSVMRVDKGAVIAEHLWIICGLDFFLQPETLTRSKKHSLQQYIIHSAVVGTFTRFLASIREWGIETSLICNRTEIVGIIERLCFSAKPELMMSCGNLSREVED